MTAFAAEFKALGTIEPSASRGRWIRWRGLTVRITDFPAPVDSTVEIATGGGIVPGQVIGFEAGRTIAMSLGRMEGIRRGTRW